MATADVIDRYYETANAGDWDAWCDLFTDDMVMDEQLAGHIETLATLRPMMAGMGRAYSKFQNVPTHIVVSGDEAAVVSHISAANAAGDPIEANVMNYFKIRDGKISYMANFHDSVPFRPFLDQKLGLTAMATFDHIVIGAGAAGSAVANRLSEDAGTKVLLLEAGGPDVPPNVHDATIWYTLLGSDVDWKYFSEPQAGLDGRKTFEPRGKLPGGSSDFYIMMHIRGHTSDYDGWAAGGATGWSYQDCLPYFQKLEGQEDDTSPWAGHDGPLPLTNAGKHDPNPTSQAFIDACLELGYPPTDDFNGPNMEGVGWHHINVVDGKRFAAYRAYLEPALKRPNLTFETDALASRLLIEDGRCVGVEYRKGGRNHRAHASGEVIVCAGAIESPKLLLLSGIGDPDELRAVGVEPLVDLPGVGRNFHNHVLTGVIHESPQPVPPGKQNLSESALFLRSDPAETGPDLQIAFVHVPFNIIVGQGHPNSISILPGVVRPKSRGTVKLASDDPTAHPLVDPNYMGDPSDLEKMVKAVKISREIFGTRAFAPWVGQELMPADDPQTDDELRAFVRATADSYHHQAGSCKMGTDALAVVDPELRVRGVAGLRVADASVMPVVPSGNCHAGILMIAERAADWVKAGAVASAGAKA